MIARAIAKNPEVLLCNESTWALDSTTGVKVQEARTEANRAVGTTTWWSTAHGWSAVIAALA